MPTDGTFQCGMYNTRIKCKGVNTLHYGTCQCKYLCKQENQEAVISASNVVQLFLRQHFRDDKIICRYYCTAWPLWFFDLALCDFWFRDYLKCIMYHVNCHKSKWITILYFTIFVKYHSLCVSFHCWARGALPWVCPIAHDHVNPDLHRNNYGYYIHYDIYQ